MVRVLAAVAALVLASGLAACGTDGRDRTAEAVLPPEFQEPVGGRLFGERAMVLFGGQPARPAGEGAGLGVNAFLWRATLDTLSFMPLSSADPFGGVIITDWHAPPGVTNERFRATAFILGRQLRSDGVRVVVFRQEARPGLGWVDVPVSPSTAAELEDQVLNRARELRARSVAVR